MSADGSRVMSESYWRKQAAPIIAAVLADMKGEPDKVIRKALRDAYPFGPRQHHPYKIWCDEIKVQTGTKAKPKVFHDPNQTELFA